MENVVVRFAPSPTGYLHIGGARTAIYNWLFARKHHGRFILRIEDTDAERSCPEAIGGILEGLHWLGLQWDDGPYFQSQFVAEHQAAAQKLIEKGMAYKCFCSPKSLEQKRKKASENKKTYQYDGTCRNLSPFHVEAMEKAGRPFTIRLKVPQGDGAVIFEDKVYGTIEKKYCDIEDFIIVRANGQPLYVLSNAVDDIRDGVTHVIRGQDGLANTPKQILIYQGLEASLPYFAHMSLTLDPQKTKISKRKHGEQVAIHYYRQKGFLPWAMVNFLVLLGWSNSKSQTFFNQDELIQAFDLDGIGRTNSVFNIKADNGKHLTDPKLMNINAHYLRSISIEVLFPLIKDQLAQVGLWQSSYENDQKKWFLKVIELIRMRFFLITDFVTYGQSFFSDEFLMDQKAFKKNIQLNPDIDHWMPLLVDDLDRIDKFDPAPIELVLRDFIKKQRLKTGQLMNAIRTAVTGQSVGPDFIQVLILMGKERVVQRLRRVVEML